MSRVMSSFIPSQPKMSVAAEAGKPSDSEPSLLLIELGDSFLEILTFQILICCHLKTQDCLFVVRGVQILALQSGPTATNVCFSFCRGESMFGEQSNKALCFTPAYGADSRRSS